MHWIVGLLPGRQVAARIAAVGRCGRQRIIVIDVAQIAGHVGVTIGEQEAGGAVVENSRGPSSDRMARRASRSRHWKSSGDVIRNVSAKRGGALEGGLVTAIAVRRTEGVIVIHVAGGARRRRGRQMCSGQGKAGGAVIECRSCPTYCRVANGAICRGELRTRCGVHRVSRLLPCRQMATGIPAVGGRNRQRVVVIDVARCAGHARVSIGKRKACGVVIESGRRPVGCVVAIRAICKCEGRSGTGMHGIARLLPVR